MKKLFIVFFLLSGSAFAEDERNPLNENASFQLDKNSARTSGLISKGSVYTVVDKFLPDHERGPSYNVKVSYDLTIKFAGRKQGVINFLFPEDYFTPVFMERLRKEGTYVSPDYKISYEGKKDVRTLDGGVYPQTDMIYITDIVIPDSFAFVDMMYAVAGIKTNPFEEKFSSSITDLKLRASIYPGIPALGAVKVDMTGKTNGVNAKAGFDYLRH